MIDDPGFSGNEVKTKYLVENPLTLELLFPPRLIYRRHLVLIFPHFISGALGYLSVALLSKTILCEETNVQN